MACIAISCTIHLFEDFGDDLLSPLDQQIVIVYFLAAFEPSQVPRQRLNAPALYPAVYRAWTAYRIIFREIVSLPALRR